MCPTKGHLDLYLISGQRPHHFLILLGHIGKTGMEFGSEDDTVPLDYIADTQLLNYYLPITYNPQCLTIQDTIDFVLTEACDGKTKNSHIHNTGHPLGGFLLSTWTLYHVGTGVLTETVTVSEA